MMITRLISEREGSGVAVGVKVGLGVNVAVIVGVRVGGSVARDVGVMVGVFVGKPVGVGTGGNELPQMLGMGPQLATRKARRKTVRRFREIYSKHFCTRILRKARFFCFYPFDPLHPCTKKNYFNIGILMP